MPFPRTPEAVFRPVALLKKDLMGTIESGVLECFASGPVPAVRRSRRTAPAWARPVAWALARREVRALAALEGEEGVPALLREEPDGLIRSFIEGRPLDEVRPADPRFYSVARRLLRAIHRRGVSHNDTHKEANWLVTPDGRPALVDFQLASRHGGRGAWFRLCRLEDVRHLLKHKRTHCPSALTARERALLGRKSWPAKGWEVLVKPLYLFLTRRLFRWRDREGRGYRESGPGASRTAP
jgi:hypothetical protein